MKPLLLYAALFVGEDWRPGDFFGKTGTTGNWSSRRLALEKETGTRFVRLLTDPIESLEHQALKSLETHIQRIGREGGMHAQMRHHDPVEHEAGKYGDWWTDHQRMLEIFLAETDSLRVFSQSRYL
jgi:hypothetical protein